MTERIENGKLSLELDIVTVIKVRCEKLGGHVTMRFFIGREGYTMPGIGYLVGDVGDYQIMLAMIGLGAEQTRGRVKFVTEGWSPDQDAPNVDEVGVNAYVKA